VGDGVVRLRRETAGRKGKAVTVITGVPLDDAGLRDLARDLKRMCGAGGTIRDGVIEIQGDRRDKLREALVARGFTVKLAGG
jgi:translation initiation factor 1